MVVAVVNFLRSEQGGRHTPPQSGFRPQVNIRGDHTSCLIESIEGVQEFSFDVEHSVNLTLMFPAQYPNAFKVGDIVDFYEGNKRIGHGRIMKAT